MTCAHDGAPVAGNCPACLLELGVGDDAELAAGTMVGERFRIVAPLGRGGMGEVYRADDLKLGHAVALKFVDASEATLREVRAGREIAHPNVCRIYDVVDAGDQAAIVMELVDGEDLETLLAGGLPTMARALEIARDVCHGLEAIHDRGLAHGDLKPANVMIDRRGRVRITDLGLAHRAGDAARFGGTPAYMAPEQFATRAATKESDLYSLGMLLSELFGDDVPIVERCLRADPAQRPASAANVLAEIESGALDRASDRALRLTRAQAWTAGALTVAAIALLAFLSRVPAAHPPAQPRPLQGNVYIVLLTAALAAGVLLAWRNLRAGRVDRAGASRVALFVFVCRAASGAVAASRPPTLEAAAALLSAILGAALFLAAQVWLAYVALEPTVRAEWPDALAGWTRLLRGRVRDALIGRDLLLGALAGVVMRLATPAFVAPAASSLLYALARAAFYALFALFLLLLLRMAVRQPWIAGALWLLATTAMWGHWDPIVAAQMLVLLIVLQRLGLLAAAVAIFTFLIGAV